MLVNPMWVLRTEPGSYVGAASGHRHRALSLALSTLKILLLLCVCVCMDGGLTNWRPMFSEAG